MHAHDIRNEPHDQRIRRLSRIFFENPFRVRKVVSRWQTAWVLWAMSHPGLTPTKKLILRVILDHTHLISNRRLGLGRVIISAEKLGGYVDIAGRSARRSIRQLEDAGLLRTSPTGRGVDIQLEDFRRFDWWYPEQAMDGLLGAAGAFLGDRWERSPSPHQTEQWRVDREILSLVNGLAPAVVCGEERTVVGRVIPRRWSVGKSGRSSDGSSIGSRRSKKSPRRWSKATGSSTKKVATAKCRRST